MKQELIYAELSYELTGIFFKVHNDLGRYCNEKQYGDSLKKEFVERRIQFEREKVLEASFEGEERGRNKVDYNHYTSGSAGVTP